MEKLREFRITTVEESGVEFEKLGVVRDSRMLYDIIKEFWHEDIEIYESFFILLLNRRNKPIGFAKISQGGVAGTCVDPKILAFYVAKTLASGVCLAHNHPSGNLNPSQADYSMTEKVKKGLSYLDCNVLDHLILTKDGYYSFADEGKI